MLFREISNFWTGASFLPKTPETSPECADHHTTVDVCFPGENNEINDGNRAVGEKRSAKNDGQAEPTSNSYNSLMLDE